MITSENNPTKITIAYKDKDGENTYYTVRNAGDTAFQIVYDIFLRDGAKECLKHWVSPEAVYEAAFIEVEVNGTFIAI